MKSNSQYLFAGIIPARYGSSRFPGKSLALIGNKPLIQRVYEQASKVLNLIYVATDDKRIYDTVKNFGGKVPESRDEILRLPGVGDYVSGIVLSIAFNKKEWIVDSNVVRAFKRYFGISTSKEGRRDKHVIDIARTYVDCKYPGKANLALLDFAALICTPRKPEHERCPLYGSCHFSMHLK